MTGKQCVKVALPECKAQSPCPSHTPHIYACVALPPSHSRLYQERKGARQSRAQHSTAHSPRLAAVAVPGPDRHEVNGVVQALAVVPVRKKKERVRWGAMLEWIAEV